MMDHVGIPSTLHPASPIPIHNSKSLLTKRRLTYEEVDAVKKGSEIQKTPKNNSELLLEEKQVLRLDPRRSPRLVEQGKKIEEKKAKDEDDYAANEASSTALCKNCLKILNYATAEENAKSNTNAKLIFLISLLKEKVEKLDKKIEKLFVKVETRNTTLHEEVIECLRSYFQKKASADPIKSGAERGSKVDEVVVGKNNGEFGDDGGEFARFANIEELINMCRKVEA
ncbi:uncharacterized protein LOC130993579 [Salvia miltiorrhiza]|uniref:uncharacterized protein LOC130993579 n=1 Tax=Salvia miltiorrhiza TaxID=226208 RepID=UPI0025AD155F|nr:uncharacterized protein LOC130993579 [Salvia miltiorrhiza]XP_057774491.1 uncharacterized protein LOC130993579 [Salvia miltiorrhiza]